MTARTAFPQPLCGAQLGPVIKHFTCAYAWRDGCGLKPARFYVCGWRCDGHRPGAVGGGGAG
jgi:hypothetical protein